MKLTYEHVTLTNVAERFATFASDLGLRPGEWPAEIETEIGNGHNLVRSYSIGALRGGTDYELEAVTYKQLDGNVIVTVYND